MAESAESKRLTLVKPRSTWVITSKTEPTTPIDPLDQVNTPLWSTLGQRHGQTPLKHWRRRMSSGTFVAFSKFHLNTSKYIFMKVVQLVGGHNFRVEWHFKFWAEKGGKLGQLAVPPVHRDMAAFKVGKPFLQKPLRKHLRAFVKVVEGSEIYNFGIHCSVHFSSSFGRKPCSKLPSRNGFGRVAASPRRRDGQAPRAPAPCHTTGPRP
jgi:hypothetical protein